MKDQTNDINDLKRELEEQRKQLAEQQKALEKQKNRKVATVICAVAVVAVAVAAVLFTATHALNKEPEGYVLNESNYEQIKEEMSDKVAEGYFETYMNTIWTFEDGESESRDAVFGNSPNNAKPIRCEVSLDDTEEIVFKSAVLPVGTELSGIKLDRKLAAGTYPAVCRIYLLTQQEDGSYIDFSDAGFTISIVVEN